MCLILKCNYFYSYFWTPPLLLSCNQKVLSGSNYGEGDRNSMTAELIRIWSTELIINSLQKSCRSLFQPVPPPLPPHLKMMGQTQDGGNGAFFKMDVNPNRIQFSTKLDWRQTSLKECLEDTIQLIV